jgi:ABC-type Fe3+-hydroxamate transport system substrate-binding protein
LRDVLPADIERPTVAILYDLDTLGSAGRGTWVDDLLQVLRLDNIANEAQTPWPSLSREALLARDPDFILMQEPEDPAAVAAFRKRIEGLGQDPMWGRLSAIRQGRLVILGPNMLNVPGPRSIQTLEAMAQAVYGWQGAETGSGE